MKIYMDNVRAAARGGREGEKATYLNQVEKIRWAQVTCFLLSGQLPMRLTNNRPMTLWERPQRIALDSR